MKDKSDWSGAQPMSRQNSAFSEFAGGFLGRWKGGSIDTCASGLERAGWLFYGAARTEAVLGRHGRDHDCADWGFGNIAWLDKVDSRFVSLVVEYIEFFAMRGVAECLARSFIAGVNRKEIANACLFAMAAVGSLDNELMSSSHRAKYVLMAREAPRIQAGLPRAVLEAAAASCSRAWRTCAKPVFQALLMELSWPMDMQSHPSVWLETEHDAMISLVLCDARQFALDAARELPGKVRAAHLQHLPRGREESERVALWIAALTRAWCASIDGLRQDAEASLRQSIQFIDSRLALSALELRALGAVLDCGGDRVVDAYLEEFATGSGTEVQRRRRILRARRASLATRETFARFRQAPVTAAMGAAFW